MVGVNILNQYPEMFSICSVPAVIAVAVSLAVISIVIAIVYGVANQEVGEAIFLGFVCLIVSAMITTVVTGCTTHFEPTGKTIYQVTVDESVSYSEFMDKYNVISQDGKIYTIMEKDSTENNG